MKTCKDCIYWTTIPKMQFPEPFEIGMGDCRLYPEPRENVFANHWCGQLKEKVTTKEPFQATNLCDLNLSFRARNILQAQGIDIHKLRTMSKVDLLKIPQCGLGTTENILDALYRDGGMKS